MSDPASNSQSIGQARSLTTVALALFLTVLLLVTVLGAAFFWYQRTLFDPKGFNRQLADRAEEVAGLLAHIPRENARTRRFLRADGAMLIGINLDLPAEIRPIDRPVAREVRRFRGDLVERLSKPFPSPSERWFRGNGPGSRRAGEPDAGRGPSGASRTPIGRVASLGNLTVEVVEPSSELIEVFEAFESGSRRGPFNREIVSPTGGSRASPISEELVSQGAFDATRRYSVLVRAETARGLNVALLLIPVARNQLSTWLLIIGFVGALLTTAGFAAYAMMRVTRPLEALARSTREFGQSLEPTNVDARGAGEVAVAIDAFTDMQTRVRALMDERVRITGAVSHDLRTYLTRFRLRTEVLAQTLKPNAGEGEFVERTIADIDEMEEILAASLTYARYSTRDPKTLNLETISLVSLLRSVQMRFEEQGKRWDFSIEGHSDAQPDQWMLQADATALRRLFTNVLDNAFKYARDPSVVIARVQGALVVSIRDYRVELDGAQVTAVSDETRAFWLKPYARGEDSRSRETGGTGLGLSIASDITAAHGGDFTLQSRRDGEIGTEVVVRLPQSRPSNGA